MPAKKILLEASTRSALGTNANRRIRRLDDQVPGVLYGGGMTPTPVQFTKKHIVKALENEAIYAQMLTVVLDGKPNPVLLKGLQRHPYKLTEILHLDFQRVNPDDFVHAHIPLHFLNESSCPGIQAGGVATHHFVEIELKCRAKNLPEYIEVDLANLKMDEIIHIGDLKLPENAELVSHSKDSTEYKKQPIVSIHQPRAMLEEEEPAAADLTSAEVPTVAETEGKKSDNKSDSEKSEKSGKSEKSKS